MIHIHTKKNQHAQLRDTKFSAQLTPNEHKEEGYVWKKVEAISKNDQLAEVYTVKM